MVNVTDGHRTSTIARPRPSERHGPNPSEPSTSRAGLLGDLTRPIPVDKRLVQRQTNRLALSLIATLIVSALVASIFVFPVQAWLRQGNELDVRKAELATLNDGNELIQAENDRLLTNEGIKEAARDEISYVEAGEQRIRVITVAAPSQTLPAGWPYDQVTQIVALRRAEAAALAAVPAPTP